MPRTATRLSVPEALRIFGLNYLPGPIELRKKFTALCRETHPDKGGTPEQFTAVKDAYEVLKQAIVDGFGAEFNNAERAANVSRETTEDAFQKLNDNQKIVCLEILEWLKSGNKMRLLEGPAGVGKTYMMKVVIQMAVSQGVIGDGWVYAAAPTHQAVQVLRDSLGSFAHGISTVHALLGLRPTYVKWISRDQQKLEQLVAVPVEERSEAHEAAIELMQEQKEAAAKKEKVFRPATPPDLSGLRLLIVDESGMLNEEIYNLVCVAAARCGTQVIFMGDRAQLRPVKSDKISPVFDLPTFSPLTKIERYKGAILEYVEQIRRYALGELVGDGYKYLHRSITPDDEGSLIVLESHEVFEKETLRAVVNGGRVRFIASTNKRVDEINYLIGHTLKEAKQIETKGSQSGSKALYFEAGDTLLTTAPVGRVIDPVYGMGFYSDGEMLAPTSTQVNLIRPIEVGELIEVGDGMTNYQQSGTVVIEPSHWQFTSALGTTFDRSMFWCEIDGASQLGERSILLINPEQRSRWQAECKTLHGYAMSTISRGKSAKTARGQEGDTAQAVWAKHGLKNWAKRLDGTLVEQAEYDKIRIGLWKDYYNLLGFCDQANFAWSGTGHRTQGATLDVVIIDIRNMTRDMKWMETGSDEQASALYTAATRAKTQVVIME